MHDEVFLGFHNQEQKGSVVSAIFSLNWGLIQEQVFDMELELSTPALLFSAITLLMLAYTNRFLAMANLIRGLHKKYLETPDQTVIIAQIRNLRKRLHMIKNMQIFGVLSFLLCVVCMFFLYRGIETAANITFMASMLCLLISLFISLVELQISTRALNIELSDMEDVLNRNSSSIENLFKKK